jgi:hypothetical protein
MKKVLLFLLLFIVIGTYINRLDRSYIPYPAEPLVVVPEGQTTSSVLGAVQAASTWGLVDSKKTKNPYDQIDAMVEYVKVVYGDGCKAWDFRYRNGWY